MPTAPPNPAGIELYYETFGDPSDEPLLFVMGLGAQMHVWDEELLQAFVDRGFFAIRFDNRDVGLSTKVDAVPAEEITALLLTAMGGGEIEAPYLLADMANDAVGLLDHLGIESAHLLGASMGGMIVQQMVIDHPERVRSITSIMSTTGDPDVGAPEPETLTALLRTPGTTREEVIDQDVATARLTSSPVHFDEDAARRRAERSYDRCHHPEGRTRQLVAAMASGSRTAALGSVTVPALVIHGAVDPLITPSGGERTAEAIPGAELLILDEMGHDLPPVLWPQIIEAVTKVAARSAATA